MIVLWLCTYTVCLCNTLFVLYVWSVNKLKAVFALFLLVFNVFMITAISFFILLLNASTLMSQFFIYLFISFLSLTIPFFILRTMIPEDKSLTFPKYYIGLYVILVAIFCFAFFCGNRTASFWINIFLPFIFTFLAISIKKQKYTQSNEQKRLSKTGISLFIVASLLLVLYGILYKQSCNRELLSQYFFGLFPIAYQIPVFIYNYSSLKRHTEQQKEILEKMQMPIETDQFLNKNFALPNIDLLCKKLKLSKREAETAIKLYEGKTYNQIADELFVSLSAIKKHAYNIYRKLDITNKYQLMQKMNEIL